MTEAMNPKKQKEPEVKTPAPPVVEDEPRVEVPMPRPSTEPPPPKSANPKFAAQVMLKHYWIRPKHKPLLKVGDKGVKSIRASHFGFIAHEWDIIEEYEAMAVPTTGGTGNWQRYATTAPVNVQTAAGVPRR